MKTGELAKRPFDWRADVARLTARTLLTFADAECITPDYMTALWQALGGGLRDAGLDGSLQPAHQLAIVPGVTYCALAVDPRVAEIVTRFLGEG